MDAGDQFSSLVEGFRHVVVGADAETLDLVLDARARPDRIRIGVLNLGDPGAA